MRRCDCSNIDRRQRYGAVGEQFDQNATGGDHNVRPELRIVDGADGDLDPLRHHALDQHGRAETARDAVVGGTDGSVVAKPEMHAAGFRLVRDVRRRRLQRDRVTQRLRCLDRGVT